MNHGVHLEVVWLDDDCTQLQVRASNGRFSGGILLYCDHGDIRRQADLLAGLPRTRGDFREVALGSFDPDSASGGVRLLFRCRDSAGHVAVDVHLRSDCHEAGSQVETAEFVVDVEPAAIDSFVKELRVLGPAVGSTARLVAAPSTPLPPTGGGGNMGSAARG